MMEVAHPAYRVFRASHGGKLLYYDTQNSFAKKNILLISISKRELKRIIPIIDSLPADIRVIIPYFTKNNSKDNLVGLHDIQRITNDIIELMEATFTSPIYLASNPIGDYISLQLNTLRPNLAASLILSKCNLFHKTEPGWLKNIENRLF
tara:strand:+ start:313 stop:762 length:450 start_codon:yes stop_codon:yes gene_type:complete